MKNEYIVKSERYGHKHRFIKIDNKEPLYIFVPEQEWMPIYVTYSNSDKNKIEFIDTEGGPNLYVGWCNGEVLVDDMTVVDDKLCFKLREV